MEDLSSGSQQGPQLELHDDNYIAENGYNVSDFRGGKLAATMGLSSLNDMCNILLI